VSGLPLLTARLLIRSFVPDDVAALSMLYGDPRVMRYVGIGVPLTPDETRDALERIMRDEQRHGFAAWAVTRRGADDLIGEAGLQLLEGGREVELTYLFSPAAWGKGYASEAAAAVLDYGFTELGLSRVVAVAYPANAASLAVLRKLGMRSEGVAHHYGGDLLKFALLRDDWQASRAGRPSVSS